VRLPHNFRLKIVAGHQAEKSRLPVSPGGGALSLRAAIFLKLEQGRLVPFGGLPSLKLLAAEFAYLLPAIGVAA
jgi:hypothetical protein